jgi:exonuclease VII small subunit
MDKSKTFIIYGGILVILLIAAITGWVSFARYQTAHSNLMQDYIKSKSDYEASIQTMNTSLEDTESELSDIQTTLEDTENRLDDAENTLEVANEIITEKESELAQASEEIVTLKVDNADLRKDILKLRPLEDLLCDDQISMDYSGILNSTSRLSSYVGGLSDVARVSLTMRSTLWSNAESKVHVINYVARDDNEVYSKQFLVYYNELRWKPGTFYIDGQCWLDAP